MMAEFPKDTSIDLTFTRDIAPSEALDLHTIFERLGVTYSVPDVTQFSYTELDSRLMLEHAVKTLPETADDYLGKDHFWYFGKDHRQQQVSGLFRSLVKPTLKNSIDDVDPSVMGLSVVDRTEAGLSVAKNVLEILCPKADRPHIRITGRLAIQASGIIALGMNPKPALKYHQMGKRYVEALQGIGEQLETHLGRSHS